MFVSCVGVFILKLILYFYVYTLNIRIDSEM